MTGTSRGGSSTGRPVSISRDRLQEFLQAEMRFLAKGGYNTMSLEQILALPCLEKTANVIQVELPARYAVRMQQIEAATPHWQEIPSLAELHGILKTSFTNLRLVEFEEGGDLKEFTDVILDLRRRHKAVMPLLSESAVDLREREILDDQGIHEFLLRFMNSRMGTELLTRHYVGMLPDDTGRSHFGLVDPQCCPARTCRDAIEHVRSNVPGAPGVNINLKVAQADIEFSFITTILFWILVELIENSVLAVLRWSQSSVCDRSGDVNVSVCAGSSHVGIRISDEGGGIPFEHVDKIWQYMYSANDSCVLQDSSMREPLGGVSARPVDGSERLVGGPSVGLPNCRLYVRYLGGSIDLMSMPGIGTDVYLRFTRIVSRGVAPQAHSSASA